MPAARLLRSWRPTSPRESCGGRKAAIRPVGERWRTSLDLALQRELEEEARHAVDQLRSHGGRHAAVVVLDNQTGEVLAWVGSPDFWADTAGQVDMVSSPRQPGSALKPFLYALAFDRGYTPATVLPDDRAGVPDLHRPLSRRATTTADSTARCGPARRSAARTTSPRSSWPSGSACRQRCSACCAAAGFTSLGRSADFYGLGLALGNGDVTLLELANGYRALATGGVWRPCAVASPRRRDRRQSPADGS